VSQVAALSASCRNTPGANAAAREALPVPQELPGDAKDEALLPSALLHWSMLLTRGELGATGSRRQGVPGAVGTRLMFS